MVFISPSSDHPWHCFPCLLTHPSVVYRRFVFVSLRNFTNFYKQSILELWHLFITNPPLIGILVVHIIVSTGYSIQRTCTLKYNTPKSMSRSKSNSRPADFYLWIYQLVQSEWARLGMTWTYIYHFIFISSFIRNIIARFSCNSNDGSLLRTSLGRSSCEGTTECRVTADLGVVVWDGGDNKRVFCYWENECMSVCSAETESSPWSLHLSGTVVIWSYKVFSD